MATTISGKVKGEEGTPAPYAVVELHNVTDDVITQVTVDEQGRYRFHVTEGLWQLKAWDPHGHRGERQVNVASGEETHLDVGLH
jgi:hypothetical protein